MIGCQWRRFVFVAARKDDTRRGAKKKGGEGKDGKEGGRSEKEKLPVGQWKPQMVQNREKGGGWPLLMMVMKLSASRGREHEAR